jgi:hypothetical protein
MNDRVSPARIGFTICTTSSHRDEGVGLLEKRNMKNLYGVNDLVLINLLYCYSWLSCASFQCSIECAHRFCHWPRAVC